MKVSIYTSPFVKDKRTPAQRNAMLGMRTQNTYFNETNPCVGVLYDVRSIFVKTKNFGYHNRKPMSTNSRLDLTNLTGVCVSITPIEIVRGDLRQWVISSSILKNTPIYIYDSTSPIEECYDMLLFHGFLFIQTITD